MQFHHEHMMSPTSGGLHQPGAAAGQSLTGVANGSAGIADGSLAAGLQGGSSSNSDGAVSSAGLSAPAGTVAGHGSSSNASAGVPQGSAPMTMGHGVSHGMHGVPIGGLLHQSIGGPQRGGKAYLPVALPVPKQATMVPLSEVERIIDMVLGDPDEAGLSSALSQGGADTSSELESMRPVPGDGDEPVTGDVGGAVTPTTAHGRGFGSASSGAMGSVDESRSDSRGDGGAVEAVGTEPSDPTGVPHARYPAEA